MSPRARERLRWIAGVWLAWTVAGLFYITQDSVPRLYRGEYVPWKSGVYWILACRNEACFVIAASRQGA